MSEISSEGSQDPEPDSNELAGQQGQPFTVFCLEHMTVEQALQLSSALEEQFRLAQARQPVADDSLLVALETELAELPQRNLVKAQEMFSGFVNSPHGYDRLRASFCIGHLICADPEPEDSIGLWLQLVL